MTDIGWHSYWSEFISLNRCFVECRFLQHLDYLCLLLQDYIAFACNQHAYIYFCLAATYIPKRDLNIFFINSRLHLCARLCQRPADCLQPADWNAHRQPDVTRCERHRAMKICVRGNRDFSLFRAICHVIDTPRLNLLTFLVCISL